MRTQRFSLKYRLINLLSLPALLFAVSVPGIRAQDNILTLESAIQRALARNEQALSADQGLRAAESRVSRARAYFLPQITATGNYLRRPFQVSRVVGGTEIVIQSYNAVSGVLALNLTVFDSQGIPGFRNLRSERAAQEFATLETKRQLAFEVSNAYLTTLGVDQVLVASQHRYDYAKQALEAARARYSAGLVGVNDVTRAELEFATAEMGITQVRGQVQTTYLELGYLIDDPEAPGKKLEVPDFLLTAAEDIPLDAEQLIAEAQNRRLDLNSLRWHAQAQHALVLGPTLKWFPSLTLNAQYRYTNEAGLTGRNTNWNAGLTLNWTIFDGFNRTAEYVERKSLAIQADLDVQASLRRVELEVRDALVSLESQKASLKQAVVAQDVAKRNATEIAELYRQGLASALQVADANVRLFEAEVTLVRERYGLGISFLNFEAALGLDPFGKEPEL